MSYDQLQEILDNTDDAIETLMQGLEPSTNDLGLDARSGRVYAIGNEDEGYIIAPLSTDKSLQYYGGFEYVDKEYRHQYGQWVFYSAEDSRVSGHLSRLTPDEEGEE
jgi:hypothetical protein